MTGQPTLDGTPVRAELWAKVKAGATIDHAAWLRAHAERSFVGACVCGGYLTPRPPEELVGRTDYNAACTSCGKEIDCPGGRLHTRKRGG